MTDYTLELKLKSSDGKIVWSDDVTMSIRSMIGFGEGGYGEATYGDSETPK